MNVVALSASLFVSSFSATALVESIVAAKLNTAPAASASAVVIFSLNVFDAPGLRLSFTGFVGIGTSAPPTDGRAARQRCDE